MEQVNETANAVRKEVTISAITVDKVYKGDFQKEGTMSAQIRQEVTTVSFYPSKQVSSSLADNPFKTTEFGFEETDHSNTEKRVAWIDVPAGVSADDVLAKIPVDANLYRIMSNRPILSNHQAYSIEAGQKTLDDYANSQVVRFGEGSENAGQLIKDANGKPQYRQVFYSNTTKADVEMRTEKADDFYASALIRAEFQGASTVVGQSLHS